MRDKWLYWCGLNDEQSALEKLFDKADFVSIKGSTPHDQRGPLERKWRLEDVPIMISKVSVFGFGMNWQHCNNVVFVGLSDSFEAYYQAVRRCWRFGQKKPVNVYIVISEKEGSVVNNIKAKELRMDHMVKSMVRYMRDESIKEIGSISVKKSSKYNPTIKMVCNF